MTPTETLKHEHQIVLLVLEGAERRARTLAEGAGLDAGVLLELDEIVDFLRNFVDRCHHGKEEKHYFERMVQRGMAREAGPIAVMLHEHEQGRALVRALAAATAELKAGNASARALVANALHEFVELLRAHIFKEDNILYPMADQLFTPEDLRALTDAFDRIEAEEMGEGVHEKYHELAHRLAGRAR